LAVLFFLPAARLSADDRVTLLFTGDVMMAYRMKDVLRRKGADYPFQKVLPELAAADAVVGNLECPVSSAGEKFPDKDYNFLMSPRVLPALKRANFKVLTLANNHVLDYGAAAFANTRHHLRKNGLLFCGGGKNLEAARRPAVLSVNGKKIAFLAYNRVPPLTFSATAAAPGTAFADIRFIRKDVAAAKTLADWVVVSFHWGVEYDTGVSEARRKLAHATLDAGADAVIGHHPHIVQAIEIYKEKIIAYSLGNFVFGTYNPGAEGMLLKLTLEPGQPMKAEALPLWVDNRRVRFQPRPFAKEAATAAVEKWRSLSEPYGATLAENDGPWVQVLPVAPLTELSTQAK